jgi:hypothetical protein
VLFVSMVIELDTIEFVEFFTTFMIDMSDMVGLRGSLRFYFTDSEKLGHKNELIS